MSAQKVPAWFVAATLLFAACFGLSAVMAQLPQDLASIASVSDPEPSAGALALRSRAGITRGQPTAVGAYLERPVFLDRIFVDRQFEGFRFADNLTEADTLIIPPDPIGAAGHSRVIAVGNAMIEARDKGGALQWRAGLPSFFAPLSGTLDCFTDPDCVITDPKIVYDEREDRFVVVALHFVIGTASVSPTNVSRILLAVSKDGNPQGPTPADWHFLAINAKQVIPRRVAPPPAPLVPFDHWADYPGFEVDEEAVYITANMLTFVPFGSFGGSRLWIVAKGAGTGGVYDGGPGTVTVHNPYAGGGLPTTTMPALVQGPGGAGPSVGTYLVSSGIFNSTGIDFVQVVRVDDPLGRAGGPSFVRTLLPVGDIGTPSLLGAPQFGSPVRINTNDGRALDAVWQNDRLWITTTIRPNAGPDLNQTTAHWFELDTSAGVVTLVQQGNIGGEDIAPGTYTFFPSVAVNRFGAVAFGFSASAPTIYAGAFVTGRSPFDEPGTVRHSEVVHAGLAPYVRTFGGGRNRWGDYSGIATDPSNDDFYWVFNEYADTPGDATGPPLPLEDGRWGTAWARAKFVGGGN
jgi:hypothetical protein